MIVDNRKQYLNEIVAVVKAEMAKAEPAERGSMPSGKGWSICRPHGQAEEWSDDHSDTGVSCRSKGDIVMRKMTAFTAFAVALALVGWSDMSNAATPASMAQSSTFGTARGAYANPNIPGATGRTIVLGDHSTIAGDAAATQMQRTGRF
jgi:hypothetical protein